MEIVSRTGHRIVSRLWFEHKIDARDQPGQRERYVRALRDLDGGGRLLYIVRDVGRTRQEGEWTSVTWQQIGELADALGRASAPGGRHWRDDARKPGSAAQWRLLYELLWY